MVCVVRVYIDGLVKAYQIRTGLTPMRPKTRSPLLLEAPSGMAAPPENSGGQFFPTNVPAPAPTNSL